MSGLVVTQDDITTLADRLDSDAWDAFWLALGIVVREVAALRRPEPVIAAPEPVLAVASTPTPDQYGERTCPVCGKGCRGEVGLSAHRRTAHRTPKAKVLPNVEPKPVPVSADPAPAPAAFADRAAAAARRTWDERHEVAS